MTSPSAWKSVNRDGVALYEFEANGEHQVSLRESGRVSVEQENSGWYRGVVHTPDGHEHRGIFPATYVDLVDECPKTDASFTDKTLSSNATPGPGSRPSPATVSGKTLTDTDAAAGEAPTDSVQCPNAAGGNGNGNGSEALLGEIETVLRSWRSEMQRRLMEGELAEHHELQERSSLLLLLRRRLLVYTSSSSLSCEDRVAREQLRQEIVELLESCRGASCGQMVPRTLKHAPASTRNCGIMQLLQMHRDMFVTLQKEASSLWRLQAAARRGEMRARTLGDTSELCAARLPDGELELVLDVKACIFSVGENTEVYFSLYSSAVDAFVSEEYLVELTPAGMPQDLSLLGKLQTLYVGLRRSDFEQGLHLVAHIYRYGTLRDDVKKSKKKQIKYRRPFGCALFSLSDCQTLLGSLDKEYTPPNDCLTIYRVKEANLFPDIHSHIMRNSNQIEVVPKTKGLALGLCLRQATAPVTDTDNATANADAAADAAAERPERPNMRGDVAVLQRLQLTTSLHPGEVRNDFYVTLRGGDFQQDKKTSAKNVEIRVKVLTGTGYVMPNAIYRGCGPSAKGHTEYCTTVFYHTNSPTLHETLNVRLPPQVFAQCHLLLTIWHVSHNSDKNALFSFAFMPLARASGAVIKDGLHALPCYRPMRDLQSGQAALQYLNASSAASASSSASSSSSARTETLTRRKEEVRVITRLSSVKKTQLESLHALFNWRALDAAQLSAVMYKFLMISGSELVKFVRETFDSLFAILAADNYAADVMQLVFVGLLYTMDQLTTKMTTWRPSVQSYVNDVFASASVHRMLLSLSIETLSYVDEHELGAAPKPRRLKMLSLLCKCLEYVLKFITVSFRLERQQRPLSCDEDEAFKARVSELLRRITALLARDGGAKDPFVGCKAFVMKGFSSTLQDLATLFNPRELGEIVDGVVGGVSSTQHSKLSLYKLKLLADMIGREVATGLVSWSVVQPRVLAVLQQHLCGGGDGGGGMNSVDEAYMSVGLLSRVLLLLQDTTAPAAIEEGEHDSDEDDEVAPTIDAVPFLSLLPRLVHLVRHLQRSDAPAPATAATGGGAAGTVVDGGGGGGVVGKANGGGGSVEPSSQVRHMLPEVEMRTDAFTCLWTIVHFSRSSDLQRVLAADAAEGDGVALSMELLEVTQHVLLQSTYPSMWVVLRTFEFSVVCRLLSELARPLCERRRLLGPERFERALWFKFFEVACCLATYSSKDGVELLSAQQRSETLALVRASWHELVRYGHHRHMVPFFCSTLLPALCDSGGGCGALAMDMYFDLLKEEHARTNDFAVVSRHTIDALDTLANASQADAQHFVALLVTSLRQPLQTLAPAGERFLAHIVDLHELMSSLLRLPETEAFEHERTSIVIRLLSYLADEGGRHGHGRRKRMLYRYMHYLVRLHTSLCSFVEAGVTQVQQAHVLDWRSTEALEPEPAGAIDAPEPEPEPVRKERLLLDAIRLFERAECWERAIDVCEELRRHYERRVYDYGKLARLLEQQAKLYRNIVSGQRFYPSYFNVVFFHGSVERREDYVYKGAVLESLMDFANRIRSKWTSAHLFMSSDEPPTDLLARHELVIAITTLTPSCEATMRRITADNDDDDDDDEDKRVDGEARQQKPAEVVRYATNNDVDVFYFCKAVNKSGEKRPANEFKALWVTKTYLRCESSFPTNRKRIGVVERLQHVLCPIDVAVETIRNKNAELCEKIEQVEAHAFAQRVDVGPLSMNLNGILDAAVNGGTRKYIDAFLAAEPSDMQRSQERLKRAMRQQQTLLRRGLDVFCTRKDASLDPLFSRLQDLYGKMLASTNAILY